MKRAAAVLLFVVLCSTIVALAQAQETPPARESAPPSELEPAVDTSAEPVSPPASEPPAATPATVPPARAQRGSGGRVMDRIELDTTQITGNRELPKVLYIVPWKRSDLGDLVGRPVNSLLDEVLAPVDRDVFKRENRYYRALQPDETLPGGAAPASSQRGGTSPAPAADRPVRDER
ncbi:MAG TPA: hypothetical protein VJ011_08030 [Steroidobacteraceae bacterium]|nr:hypothetical protein [Steroidobacteraceae bacterium]